MTETSNPSPPPAPPAASQPTQADQSQHAADHVGDALSEIVNVFDGIKQHARVFQARMNKEAGELHASFDEADRRVNDRMALANQQFRRFLGGNGAPPLEDQSRGRFIEGQPASVEPTGETS